MRSTIIKLYIHCSGILMGRGCSAGQQQMLRREKSKKSSQRDDEAHRVVYQMWTSVSKHQTDQEPCFLHRGNPDPRPALKEGGLQEILMVVTLDFVHQDLRKTPHSDPLFKAHLSFMSFIWPPPSLPSSVKLSSRMGHLGLLPPVVPICGRPKARAN